MNQENLNQPPSSPQKKAVFTKPPGKTPGGADPGRKPPLFRRIDWLAFALTTLLVFVGYFYTLAPDVTLEDAGELAVGSFYAGVPHPPGYPVWTLYSWLFTVLVPVSNIAWRVALSSAVAGALSAGLIALVVSRGSSMILEGIDMFKGLDKRWENLLCLASGFVAGMIMGYNGYMWSQAVIVEVYTLSVLSLMGVICLLLRWLYEPERMRYLYWAFFFFGICLTNHMSLLVAAMGIEVAILAAHRRLGRDLFASNFLIFVVVMFLYSHGDVPTLENKPIFIIFNIIGIGSLISAVYLAIKTGNLGTEWKAVLFSGLAWLLGASFYLYMPIASMSNPPMNWGYPRTADGFVHALKRGQYESIHPTTDLVRFVQQLGMYIEGAVEEFNIVYICLALVPFLFYRFMQKRERSWLIGLTAIYFCLAIILLILLNPGQDRGSRELNRVFFTASHVFIAISMGYGMTLLGAYLLTQYQRGRLFAIYGACAAVALSLYSFVDDMRDIYGDLAGPGVGVVGYGLKKVFQEGNVQYIVYAAVFLLFITLAMLCLVLFNRAKFPLALLLGLYVIMPAHSIISHWADNEQRDHIFGFWFGHDMFTPPFGVYPEMTRNAVLYGGTDPGRFNPTYMIFCEGFIPAEKRRDPKFDRRDVYIITQNALADQTYLNYIRAHYNRSTQIDPPFFQNFFKTSALSGLDTFFTNLGAGIEKRRRELGVYPPKEIKTSSPAQSEISFKQYIEDAQRRKAIGQLKPGEDVSIDNNRVQVSGHIAVMAINGLLTKDIFDNNPDHEFFVEESFPLDWMYPHLTPFGIIMKINREQQPVLSAEVTDRDHKFWSQYSERLIGNWITSDTPVSEVCAFAERIYLHHDYKGFKGDLKFVRDDNAQKAFSKLRSSIAGLYAWRLGPECPPQLRPKTAEEQKRLAQEAEFAFKQSFAFCPYSPEAIYRYVQLLAAEGRFDDAILIAQTGLKLDPLNTSIEGLIGSLQAMKTQSRGAATGLPAGPLEAGAASGLQASLNQAMSLVQQRQTDAALAVLDQVLASPNTDPQTVLTLANAYLQLEQGPRVENALQKLVSLVPDNPEAWYDLAALQTAIGRGAGALPALEKALTLSDQRLKSVKNAVNLRVQAGKDGRLTALRPLPEFQKMTK